MPSGAKKRKAAKKKKENQNQNQSNNHSDSASSHTHPHAGEDDRESDAGEVSSPVSQDHQELRMEKEDEEIEKDSEVTDPMAVEESATRVEKEIKIEDELGKEEGIIDQIDEAKRATYDGDSSGSSAGRSSSSSSSSDDESHESKKGQAAVGSAEQADSLPGKSVEPVCDSPTAETGDSVVENMPAAHSEKITASSDRVELDVLAPADITVTPHLTEPALNENGKKKCCSAKERVYTSEISVNAATHGKGEALAESAESTLTTLEQRHAQHQKMMVNQDLHTSPPQLLQTVEHKI